MVCRFCVALCLLAVCPVNSGGSQAGGMRDGIIVASTFSPHTTRPRENPSMMPELVVRHCKPGERLCSNKPDGTLTYWCCKGSQMCGSQRNTCS